MNLEKNQEATKTIKELYKEVRKDCEKTNRWVCFF